MFKYANNHGINLRASSYTEMGKLYLQHLFHEISKQFPEVGFEENEI